MPLRSQRVREENLQTIDASQFSSNELRNVIPRRLYKYNSITPYFLEGLKEHALWFSSPLDFNDPFDCKVNLNYGRTKKEIIANYTKLFVPGKASTELNLEELYQKFLSKPGSFENVLNPITQYVLGEKLGVCCFSERNDHILMWSHYAANHAGVCLQFDSSRKGIISDNVLPVQYYPSYPKLSLSNYKREQLTAFYYHAICAKSNLWDYEFEWRAIIPEGARRTHNYQLCELTGIIFGVNTSNEDFQKIDAIIKRNHFPRLRYYRAEMNSKNYYLDIKRIES